jgi:hypothetical protein
MNDGNDLFMIEKKGYSIGTVFDRFTEIRDGKLSGFTATSNLNLNGPALIEIFTLSKSL